MRLSSLLSRSAPALLIGALALSTIAARPALAAGKNQPVTSARKCFVTPNPVSNDVEGYYTIAGSGFTAYQSLGVYVAGASGTAILMTYADSAGNFAVQGWAPSLVSDGTWNVSIAGGRKWTVLATCSFQVN
jgi:hypothetical protein